MGGRRLKIRQSKTILSALLLTFLLPLALAQLATAQETSLYVDPSTYQASELGEVFDIDVNIANITGLGCFEFKLGYNTTILDALQVIAGPFPPQVDFTAGINETEGYVWVSAMCPATDGSGTLATITFETTYASSASCALSLYDVVLGDVYGDEIPVDTSDGSYSVVPEFPVTIVTPLLLIATLAAAFLGKMVWSRKRLGPSTA